MHDDRDIVIDRIRSVRTELEALGVRHADLFGSLARGESGATSDVDIAVTFRPGAAPRDLRYFALRLDVEEKLKNALGEAIDLADVSTMRERVRKRYLRDHVRAF